MADQKKAYRSPRLTIYGDIRVVTQGQGKGAHANDAGVGQTKVANPNGVLP